MKFSENHDIIPEHDYNFIKLCICKEKSEMKPTKMLIVASQCSRKARNVYFLLYFLFSKFSINMYCIYNWENKCFLSHSFSRLLSLLCSIPGFPLKYFKIQINYTFCGLSPHFVFFET